MNVPGKAYVWALMIVGFLFAILQLPGPAFHMPHIPPHIQQFIWTIFIISGIVLLFFYLQPKARLAQDKVLPEDVLKGKIIEYQANRMGDIDKFLLEAKNQKCWIHFLPHTARMIMKTLPRRENAEVSVGHLPKKNIDNVPMYDLISGRTSSGSFYAESYPPPPPATGRKIEITGKAGRYKLDEKGRVAGIIIDNYLVDLPAHIVDNILPVIKKSVEIIIKGYERNPEEGFVNTTGLTVVKPYAISIDKTDYLL